MKSLFYDLLHEERQLGACACNLCIWFLRKMLLILTSLNLTNLSCEDCYPCFYHCFTDDVYGAWALTAGGVFWEMLSVKYILWFIHMLSSIGFHSMTMYAHNPILQVILDRLKLLLVLYQSRWTNRGPEAQCRDESVCRRLGFSVLLFLKH